MKKMIIMLVLFSFVFSIDKYERQREDLIGVWHFESGGTGYTIPEAFTWVFLPDGILKFIPYDLNVEVNNTGIWRVLDSYLLLSGMMDTSTNVSEVLWTYELDKKPKETYLTVAIYSANPKMHFGEGDTPIRFIKGK